MTAHFLTKSKNGYAALTFLMIVLTVSVILVGGFTFFALQEARVNRNSIHALEARSAAEGGIEDVMYRVITGKNIAGSETLSMGTTSVTTYFIQSETARIIRAEGERGAFQKNLEAQIDIVTDTVNFYYGVQVGDGGITMANSSQINGNVYSNGSVVGNNSSVITGDTIVAGGIADNPSVEWTVQNADQFFATASSNRDTAQSFIATAGGALNKVSVFLGKIGSPSSNITLRITTDNSGIPNRTGGLASISIPPSSVGVTPSWIDASFSSPPTLVNGTKYWIVLDYGSNSATNYWNWRKDTSDGYASNTGKYTSDWSSASAVWTNVGGDLAFRAWIGGVNTSITDTTIGGTGHANLFLNVTAGGSACPNPNCVVENPPRQNMPIPDGMIQDWRNDAAAGGTCGPPTCDSNGNYELSGSAIGSLGPIKIPGTFTVRNSATLTVTGTIWVVGNMNFQNSSLVKLDSSYGGNSGILLSDGVVDIHHSVGLLGSGTSGSYIMILSAKNATTSQVMTIRNSSLGAIYYAGQGRIRFQNSAGAKQATAYGIDMDNSATVTYESGLASTQFSSGPGGGYDVKYWREVK